MCVGCRRVNGQCRGPFSDLAEENPPKVLRAAAPPSYFRFSRLPCVVSIVLCSPRYNKRQPRALRSSLLPPRVILNGAVHPGYCSASPGRVSRHMAAMAARKDYNTQSTPGAHQSITLQHIRGGGGGGSAERCLNRKEAPSSHWGWSNWAIKSLMCLSSSGPEREEAVG